MHNKINKNPSKHTHQTKNISTIVTQTTNNTYINKREQLNQTNIPSKKLNKSNQIISKNSQTQNINQINKIKI